MSFDFLGTATPVMGTAPNQIYQNPMVPNPQFVSSQQVMVNNVPQQQSMVPQRQVNYDIPEVVTTNKSDSTAYVPNFRKNVSTITVDNPPVEVKKEKRTRTKKETGASGEIIRANNTSLANSAISGTVEDVPTAYTYAETTGMLRETLGQIDALSGELVQEFNNIRASRTMKNKYMALTNISDNLGSLLSSKIAAIKEINSAITKSNDLDYKKYKDIKAAQGAMDDDKYIADLYKAFITNPQMQAQTPQMPQMNMPMINESSMMGSSIIRANVDNNGQIMGGDQAYLNYMSKAYLNE